jgi:hypothetical protein
MTFDLNSLFPDLEALTPDGRWEMLQDWLSKNPEYGERVDDWVKQSAAQVFTEIRAMAVDKYGPLASYALNAQTVREKLLQTIEILQTCYRERAGIHIESKKEMRNERRKTRNRIAKS